MGTSTSQICRRALAALAILLTGAAVFGAAEPQAAEVTVADQPQAIRAIETATKLRLPEGTVVIGFEEGGAIDSYLSAKLTMPAPALAEWLRVLAIAPDAFSENSRYFLGTNEGWWDPEAPAELPTAQTDLAPGRILNIGIERSDPERPVVYLFWHTT